MFVGNHSAGNYTEYTQINIKDCIELCCKNSSCNVAFMYNKTCYHVDCVSMESCLPLRRANVTTFLRMALVKPVEHETWEDVLNEYPEFKESVLRQRQETQLQRNQEQLKQKTPLFFDEGNANYVDDFQNNFNPFDINEGLYKTLAENEAINRAKSRLYGIDRFENDQLRDLQMEEANKIYQRMKPNLCDLNMDIPTCPKFEDCVGMLDNPLKGICRCKPFYTRNEVGQCVPKISSALTEKLLKQNIHFNDGEENDDGFGTDVVVKQETEKPKTIQLTVSVESKNIQLPVNEASLSALVLPDETITGDKYNYLWALVAKPTGDINGTITDQTKNIVKLSNLSEGIYSFKVTVSGNHSFGEGYSNVTVSRAKRFNTPPTVMITPKQQVIKLPNKKAILDGSASIDDDKIVSWKWELVQGPIGYSPNLQPIATVELDDLTSPGNYTFKLTATDSDNAENSTTATIQVLQEIDYPPQANAGPDIILYLPHNSVTLNGTLSTDDHEIVAWEWTKDSSDESKAVDMQNTRTPMLSLSHLEEVTHDIHTKTD